MTLTAFPTLNASLSEDKKSLLQHPSHNIGVAMDTSRGLLVPCISAVEEMSILDIAEVCLLLLMPLLLISLLLLLLLMMFCCCCFIVVLIVNFFVAWDASFCGSVSAGLRRAHR